MVKTLVCPTCWKFVSASNYARHQRKHNIITCKAFTEKLQIQQYYENFQNDILADEILKKMRELYWDDISSKAVLLNNYVCALCELDYMWVISDQSLMERILNIIMDKINA